MTAARLTLRRHLGSVDACAVSADGNLADGRVLVTSSGSQFFGTAGGDGVVQVWDL
ncbi:MAG: hypothetical protein XD74_1270 [Actinobacteria bacterium 66_15]|nr:MAG: hypothetical protein XD74_1270 [Actinobacteria bacterium 66_15]